MEIIKINELINEYKISISEMRSSNTVTYYLSDLKEFDKWIGHCDIEDMESKRIEEYKQHLINKELKAKSINRKLISISNFIKWINEHEKMPYIKLTIKKIKIQRQDYLDDVLSMTDFERLVRMAEREGDKQALAIFHALYFTGVRVSELLQFKVDDVMQQYVTVIGKGQKERDAFIIDKLRHYLTDYVAERKHPAGASLFINNNNDNTMSRQSVHLIIKKYAGIAKVKLTKAHAHSFRHLAGMRMIEEGFTIDEVADILGHTDINTTRIYTRKTRKQLRQTLERL